MPLVTPEVMSELSKGKPVRGEISAHRDGHRRVVIIYPVGPASLGKPLRVPERFSVICCEEPVHAIQYGQPSRFDCVDYDVLYVDSPARLEDAVLELAGGPVTLLPWSPVRLVIRPEPRNWRIENNGRLQASAGSLGHALSFAYAAAQHEYEQNGVVPLLFRIEAGVEIWLPWLPDHDWLDDQDD